MPVNKFEGFSGHGNANTRVYNERGQALLFRCNPFGITELIVYNSYEQIVFQGNDISPVDLLAHLAMHLGHGLVEIVPGSQADSARRQLYKKR